jgi:hypothetical protein
MKTATEGAGVTRLRSRVVRSDAYFEPLVSAVRIGYGPATRAWGIVRRAGRTVGSYVRSVAAIARLLACLRLAIEDEGMFDQRYGAR